MGADLGGGTRSHQGAGANTSGIQAAGAIADGGWRLPQPGAKAGGGAASSAEPRFISASPSILINGGERAHVSGRDSAGRNGDEMMHTGEKNKEGQKDQFTP
jgi:hypothetical protein